MDESISEESGPLTTRLLDVAIKEEITDDRIREKVEINSAEVVDLCSSDEGMEES